MRRLVALALAAGCAAPQSDTWRRDLYIGMSTADGAFVGAIGGVIVGCAPFAFSHHCPDALPRFTVPLGAIAGGVAGYWLTREAEKSATTADWIVVGMLPGVVVLGGVIGAVAAVARAVSDALTPAPRRDRAAKRWSVFFATEAEARAFAAGLETPGCELSRAELDARVGGGEAVADEGAWPCDVLETSDGRWRVGVSVLEAL